MSENKPEDTASNTTADESADDNVPVDAEPDAPVEDEDSITPPPVRSRSGGLTALVAWLALIISAAAGMSMAYRWLKAAEPDVSAQQTEAKLTALSASLSATRDTVDDLRDRMSALSDADASSLQSIEALDSQFRNRLRQLESVPGRIANLENSVASIQGISAGVRDTWLLAEAEYYMQIANVQLQLAGNPHLATLALRLADERVEQLADPALIEVRRALSDELQSLEVMTKPDIEGITLTLASLASVVESLPLREQLQTSEEAPGPADSELTGMARAIASIRRTMSGFVSVRRTDQALQPLIAPEAQYFLRANLELQLQAARLALLRGEQTVYQRSLDDAASWLAKYFDTESAPVASAQQTIAEIREQSFAMTPPDISASLRLLRQLSALSSDSPSEPAQ